MPPGTVKKKNLCFLRDAGHFMTVLLIHWRGHNPPVARRKHVNKEVQPPYPNTPTALVHKGRTDSQRELQRLSREQTPQPQVHHIPNV